MKRCLTHISQQLIDTLEINITVRIHLLNEKMGHLDQLSHRRKHIHIERDSKRKRNAEKKSIKYVHSIIPSIGERLYKWTLHDDLSDSKCHAAAAVSTNKKNRSHRREKY